jgi:uroporphyrinogen-III decarboxylase
MSENNQEKHVMDFKPSPEYLARQKRIFDAISLTKPDRVPVAPLVIHYYATRAKGISNQDAMYSFAQSNEIWKETTIRHNWDVAAKCGFFPAKPLELMGVLQMEWPGGTLRDNQPFQWVEKEYMAQDEYDEMLSNPNDYMIKKYLPRISTVLAPVSDAAQMIGSLPLLTLLNGYTLPDVVAMICSRPSMVEMLEKILELVKEKKKNTEISEKYTKDMMEMGYPFMWSSVTFTAFDAISDYFRGMRGSMLDMYQVPDKLLAAIEVLTPLTINGAIMQAKMAGIKGVFIPLHRGAAGFMSDEQFAKFYWPNLKALLLGLVNADLIPIPFFEGDYTPRLEYFRELPSGKIVGHFDSIDRRKYKEIAGDIMCFWGNVPSSVMCAGTPQQVKDDVKELIDIFGDTGGLIVDSVMGIPDEAKPENVQALTDAVHEYGIY